MIDIVKLLNGNIGIYDTTSGDFIRSLSPDIVEIACNANGVVKVKQDNASVEYFDPAEVANTQVLPAAAVAFTGDCADLSELLATDFFFVASGGGGGDAVFYNKNVLQNISTTLSADSVIQLLSGNNILYFSFVVLEKITFSSAAMELSANTSTSVFGLYGSNTTGGIGTKIFNSLPIVGGGNVTNTFTPATPITLDKGLYYLALHSNGDIRPYSTPKEYCFGAFGSALQFGTRNLGLIAAAYNPVLSAVPTVTTFLNINMPNLYLTLVP